MSQVLRLKICLENVKTQMRNGSNVRYAIDFSKQVVTKPSNLGHANLSD